MKPDACTDCFYCQMPIGGYHEHDHMPIPQRAGGVEMVPACLNCHNLKDRFALTNWNPELVAEAFAECGPLGRIFLGKLLGMIADRELTDA